MKKKKTLIICMLLGIMLLTSCGKTDHQDQASVATEQTSGDSRQTTEEPAETVGGSEESTEAAGTAQAAVEAVESTESSEYAERKSIIITATNECGIDIGTMCETTEEKDILPCRKGGGFFHNRCI